MLMYVEGDTGLFVRLECRRLRFTFGFASRRQPIESVAREPREGKDR